MVTEHAAASCAPGVTVDNLTFEQTLAEVVRVFDRRPGAGPRPRAAATGPAYAYFVAGRYRTLTSAVGSSAPTRWR